MMYCNRRQAADCMLPCWPAAACSKAEACACRLQCAGALDLHLILCNTIMGIALSYICLVMVCVLVTLRTSHLQAQRTVRVAALFKQDSTKTKSALTTTFPMVSLGSTPLL